MPHDGWLDLSKPFIKAYKDGARSVNSCIEKEQIVYWYRRTLRTLDCDATDTTADRPANNNSGNYFMGRPDGWESMDDVVYIASLLRSPGTVTVHSGGQTKTEKVPAGAHIFTVPCWNRQAKVYLVPKRGHGYGGNLFHGHFQCLSVRFVQL